MKSKICFFIAVKLNYPCTISNLVTSQMFHYIFNEEETCQKDNAEPFKLLVIWCHAKFFNVQHNVTRVLAKTNKGHTSISVIKHVLCNVNQQNAYFLN